MRGGYGAHQLGFRGSQNLLVSFFFDQNGSFNALRKMEKLPQLLREFLLFSKKKESLSIQRKSNLLENVCKFTCLVETKLSRRTHSTLDASLGVAPARLRSFVPSFVRGVWRGIVEQKSSPLRNTALRSCAPGLWCVVASFSMIALAFPND